MKQFWCSREVFLAATILVGVFLAGCSPDESGGTYEDVTELRDAFVRAGGECEDWTQSNEILGASQSGECGTDAVLSVYLNQQAVQDRIAETKDSIFGSSGAEWLAGENWIINAPNVKGLQSSLGGQIVSFPDSE